MDNPFLTSEGNLKKDARGINAENLSLEDVFLTPVDNPFLTSEKNATNVQDSLVEAFAIEPAPLNKVTPDPGKAEVKAPIQKAADSSATSEKASVASIKSTAKQTAKLTPGTKNKLVQGKTSSGKAVKTQKKTPLRESHTTANLSVRVDLNRLERMNNLVGELVINRNSLSLQNEQLQSTARELLNRFSQFHNMTGQLRKLYDEMLIAPLKSEQNLPVGDTNATTGEQTDKNFQNSVFDSLEMDSYGRLHSLLQGVLEEMMLLEEAVNDVALFAKQSNQTVEKQHQMLAKVRDELMWARMLPLSEVLNRFPRLLRDLSTRYKKPVSLNMSGTGVLVDKGVLEKLYDPLVHLLRNAFDHGIESPEIRRQQGKPEQAQIEIRAYHQGNQTLIEVKDNGQGIDLSKVVQRAMERGLLAAEQLTATPKERFLDLIFEPGFSTASQVSELSGRGVGLDVVRSQLQALKGTVTVTSSPGQGTTFTLRLPLTLTIAKLLICLVGSAALAVPSDSIEEIVVPKPDQIKQVGTQQVLQWREQMLPVYRMADLIDYGCPLPETPPSKALNAVPSPDNWARPMLVLRGEQQVFALEIERLGPEQELVIKPFGAAIAPPSYTYGCTILGDGILIPVIDGAALLNQVLDQSGGATGTTTESNSQGAIESENSSFGKTAARIKIAQAPTVLVADDSLTIRQSLVLSLQKAGYRVLQARDGWEALEQLKSSSKVQLVVCDVEMPNLNGFEFLGQLRRESQLAKIPVVMLTSRSNDKHRKLAMHLGAVAYFSKPYLEQEFLAALKEIISQNDPALTPAA